MIENQATTYSLLAHIRNNGSLINGPLDIFVPLIKRVLYKLSEDGNAKGNTLSPILRKAAELYNINFPIPVIKKVLSIISNELNTEFETVLQIHLDGSYIIKEFVFEDFEEQIQNSKKEVEKIEVLFQEFCHINNLPQVDNKSVFDFIDKNRNTLSKHFTSNHVANGKDYTVAAKFVDYFKQSIPVYEMIRNIYLGSILTCYIEFKIEPVKLDVELLFDTNFIISLLDLNTLDSTNTCNMLLDICKNLGYKFTVLNDTVKEITGLLRAKVNYFDQTFLQKRINQEDIFNACERRKLSKTDLERIVDNIETLIVAKGINIIFDTSKFKNKARFSKEFEYFKTIRSNEYAALHDSTAIYYVKEKRGKRIRDFELVNCWFVNNSISHYVSDVKDASSEQKDFQQEVIKADELLNILWLSNPQVNSSISDRELVDIGLSSIVSFTLNQSLPKAQIIRELDENINKYARESLSSRDIVLLSNRIVNKQLKNLEEINNIAHVDTSQFIETLQKEASKQEAEEKRRTAKFEELFENLEKNNDSLTAKTKEATELVAFTKKFNEENANKLNEFETLLKLAREGNQNLQEDFDRKKAIRIEKFKLHKIWLWRLNSWIEFSVCLLLIMGFCWYIIVISDYNLSVTMSKFKDFENNILIVSFLMISSLIYSVFVINGLFYKYRHHSNIDAFKKNIIIPDDI